MPDPNKCPKCGGFKKPDFDICFKCSQQGRSDQPSRGGYGGGGSSGGHTGGGSYTARAAVPLPKECVFDTFYLPVGSDGKKNLKVELFFKPAEELAATFEAERMSQSSIRSLFNMLKSVERRIKVERDAISDAEVRTKFGQFARQCEYQKGRQVIPEIFLEFVRVHTETAMKNKDEFCGFVEYLTSIMARMKSRSSR